MKQRNDSLLNAFRKDTTNSINNVKKSSADQVNNNTTDQKNNVDSLSNRKSNKIPNLKTLKSRAKAKNTGEIARRKAELSRKNKAKSTNATRTQKLRGIDSL